MKLHFLVSLLAVRASASPVTTCVINKVVETVKYDFTFQNQDPIYGLLSATYKQDVSPERAGSIASSLIIKAGANQLYSKVTRRANGVSVTQFEYGPLVEGVVSATLRVAGASVVGAVDGRRFTNSSTGLVFADGGKNPLVSSAPQLTTAVQSFLALAAKPLEDCASKEYRPVEVRTVGIPLPALHERALDRYRDVGHLSHTYSASSCDICKVTGVAVVGAAEVACVLSLGIWTLGLGVAACLATAELAGLGALSLCDHSGACCPEVCGKGGTWPFKVASCCFGDEFCLDNVNGLCCSPGKRTCGGLSCCSAQQSCIETGSQRGTCCPESAVCGTTCCPGDTDQCINGQCCKPADRCGNVCCNPLNPDRPGPDFEATRVCVNPGKNLCCKSGWAEVGNSGICCRVGEVLKDGICCLPNAVLCGGKCCIGECKLGQCVPHPTDADCLSMRYRYGACPNGVPRVPYDPYCYGCDQGCCTQQIK